MPESLAVSTMRQFKSQLLLREADQMRVMAQRWTEVERQLDANISLLSREADEMRRAGKEVSAAKAYQLQRYQSLKAQTAAEFSKYADWATAEITHQQGELAKLGISHAAQAISDVYTQYGMVGTFDRLPVQAVENMAGLAGNGRPIGELLKNRINPNYSDEQALSAWQSLTNTLVKNTALGINPRETALSMRDDLAGGLQKGLVIARTEQLRVYRQANQQQYEESGVVTGHRRICDHSDRTCLACLADEGHLYPVTEPIFDHTNGRCSSIPQISGMPELQFQTGEEWLDTLDEDEQRKIMGNARYEAWKDGTPFKEFVTFSEHPTWGRSLTPTPVGKLSGVKVTGAPVSVIPEVPEFATVQEAEEWAMDNYTDKIDMPGLKVEQVASINNGVNAALSDYNIRLRAMEFQKAGKKSYGRCFVLSDAPGSIIQLQKSFVRDPLGRARAQTTAFNELKQKEMTRLQKSIADPKRAMILEMNQAKLKKWEGSIRWSTIEDAVDPLQAAASHEAGHAILQSDWNGRTLWESALSRHKANSGWHEVSHYAATSSDELFAEVTALIADGRRGAVPGKILSAYDEVATVLRSK